MEQPNGIAGFDYKITPQMMRDLPEASFKGPIWLVTSKEQAEEVSRDIKKCSVLGFDTETRPSFTKGQVYTVALLQLATADDAYVFQLAKTGLPDDLVEALSNPNVVKSGISVKGDIRELQAIKKFKPAGFVELGEFTKKNKMKNHGLQGVAAALLGTRISKKEQLSNWAKPNLTEAQIKYAANDAWIGREIYLEMRKRGWV